MMATKTIRLPALFVAMLALAACAAHQASTAVQPQGTPPLPGQPVRLPGQP